MSVHRVPPARGEKSPLTFFVVVCALSVPFILAGALSSLQVLPGIPISGFAFVCPALAAAILVYREDRSAGVKALLARSFDFDRVRAKFWYLPAILLMPFIMVVSYLVQRFLGVPIPDLRVSVVTTLALFGGFFLGGLGEELGWTGYATDPLQVRYGALRGALLLGVMWAVWHWIPLLEVPRSFGFIAWWSIGTVAARVIIVWLYNNTGQSVFVATLFHTTLNLTWQLFPINGSFYDPRVTGLVTAAVAIVVIVGWGSRLNRLCSAEDPDR